MRSFTSIDSNSSGTVSLEELLKGFEADAQMQNTLKDLDMNRADLTALFELMDDESRGQLQYAHLVESLRTIAMGDSRKHLSMLRLQTSEIASMLKKMHCQSISERESLARQMADLDEDLEEISKRGLSGQMSTVPQQLPKVSTCDKVNDVNDDAADGDLLGKLKDKSGLPRQVSPLDANASDQDFRAWLQKQFREQHKELQLSMSWLNTKLTTSLSRMEALSLQGDVQI